jgi:hypothetical protein
MVSRVGSNQFSRRLRLQSEKFDQGAERLLKNAARSALDAMVMTTPIDTSRAVSNWIVTTDGPSRDFVEPHFPGSRGSTGGLSMAETLANGRFVIEDFRMGRDRDLFITNNTPYLRYIDGSGLTLVGQQAARAELVGAKLFS